MHHPWNQLDCTRRPMAGALLSDLLDIWLAKDQSKGWDKDLLSQYGMIFGSHPLTRDRKIKNRRLLSGPYSGLTNQ